MLEHIRTTLPSILKEYHDAHDLKDVPVLVDHLRPMIERRGFADRIIWEAYDFPATNIAAQVSFYQGALGVYSGNGDYARIQYSASLNRCWQRFAVCKEMFHCILDADPANRVIGMEALMRLSELLVSDATATIERYAPHDSEGIAEILALETLFPLELRRQHKADYDAGRISDHQLALRYRIPEEHARIGMYSNYIKSMESLREATLIAL